MQAVQERFRPDPALEQEQMEELQREIAATAVFEDGHGWTVDDLADLTVAGVDQAFTGDDRAVSGIVVREDGSTVERVTASRDLAIPYIPGLLAFREGGVILDAFEELSTEPDLVLFDGSGRIHFREAGLATHLGVMLDIPAVGVAKSLLCGEPVRGLDDPLAAGERVRIEADESVETAARGDLLGYAVQTRQYDDLTTRWINPLYVSPGHRVAAETAASLVEALCDGYKLPEPVRLADTYVGAVTDG